MIAAVIKNTAEPSKDFENNCVSPNFMPIIAAAESAVLNISNPMIAEFSLKIQIFP
jgi:hypothetical protein